MRGSLEGTGDAPVNLHVLLVEGDSKGEQLSMWQHLAGQGCSVRAIHDSFLAASAAQDEWPDLVVVNACSQLADLSVMWAELERSNLDLPLLVVSDSETPIAPCASDHLPVPFTSRRLAYRVKRAVGSQPGRFLRAGDICVDTLKRNVKCRGHVLHLTPKELGLLSLLMAHAGEQVSRREIMKQVWDTDYIGDTRTLEVHIRWLRCKLEDDPKRPKHILTARGQGYRFELLT